LETLGSIPGATWRGALARAAIDQLAPGTLAHHDANFRTLFLENRVRFGNFTANGERLFPLSSRICADRKDHAVRDLLLLRELGEALPRECGQQMGSGRCCEAKLTPHDGLIRVEDGKPLHRDPPLRVTAHTAIANATLRVRDEQFYSSTAVERGTAFQGDVWVTDDEAATVFEQASSASPWLALGRGRTRGQGHATWQIRKEASTQTAGGKELEALNRPFLASNRLVFTVTLDSPCLVYDQWGLARPYLTRSDIAEAAGRDAVELADYTLVDWFSRLIPISGWNAQAGLPKSDVLAIAPGSAFLFLRTIAGTVDDAIRRQEYDRLGAIFAAAAPGIGEKWAEGYGKARFCDSIHWKEDLR
jgi:hypothetical protein